MKPSTRWMLVAAGAGALALLAWAFAPRPVAVELAEARSGRFESTIDEDARTRLADRYVVSAPLAGRLARIALREGDAVAAGAGLATLTPLLSPLLDDRTRREQEARSAGARASLDRAAARIERARIGVEQARIELRRSEQLARDGFIAPTKLDADRLAAAAAQRELDTAVQERHIAEHELEQARATLAALRPGPSAAAALVVRSPVAGQVLKVHQASEASVAAGAPLVDVGDLSRLEVVADLLTTDALRAGPGTPVRVERWGGEGVLDGRVSRVEPAAFTKVSALGVEEQRVAVHVELTSPRERWRALGDGFRVTARFVVQAVDGALLVPSSAVFPLAQDEAPGPGSVAPASAGSGAPSAPPMAAGSANPAAGPTTAATAAPAAQPGHAAHAVFALVEGRARRVPVVLGGRNAGVAWIRAGLEPGARVIVYPPPAVADGVRVRERRL